MGSTPVLKPSEVADILRKLGFEVVRQRGSHQHAAPQGALLVPLARRPRQWIARHVDAESRRRHVEFKVVHRYTLPDDLGVRTIVEMLRS